jgi:hypothetical protein
MIMENYIEKVDFGTLRNYEKYYLITNFWKLEFYEENHYYLRKSYFWILENYGEVI